MRHLDKKKIVIGEASFPKLMMGNVLYVDKTQQVKRLIENGGYYFLSRPRRFGKSLLCTTLQSLFEGQKDLFEGLWIHDKHDWSQTHPVLFLSFVSVGYRDLGLQKALSNALDKLALEKGLKLESQGLAEKFHELIVKVSEKGQVVVLIDEYDKPIIDYLEDTATAAAHRDLLKGFYGVLKDSELMKKLRLVLITGVSKFSKVSLFSDLNHLSDISMHEAYSSLTGITQEELEAYFGPNIRDLAQKEGLEHEAILARIKHWYNGYSWDGEHFLYNPFSLLRLFDTRRFSNYWFETGTPTMLVNAIRDSLRPVEEFENLSVEDSFFNKFDIENLDVKALMFQTGYLTIKSVERLDGESVYHLSHPNAEVRNAFHQYLLETYAHKPNSTMGEVVIKIRRSLRENDMELFMTQIKAVFADISYHMLPREQDDPERAIALWEGYYQSIVYLLLSLVGINIQTEVSKHKGRIDAVISTERFVYIMEFETGSAQEGMAQIKEKEYALAYRASGKPITLVAIGFDHKTRNVKDFLIENG